MKKSPVLLALITAALMVLNVTALASAHANAQIVGKQGWITIKSDTTVGDQVLTPGVYYFSHEALGNDHYVSFQKVGDPGLALQYSDEGTIGPPVRVECRMEPLSSRVKETVATTVRNGAEQRITGVEIKGENVAHEF
jgi:hypothetical protein